VLGNKAHGDKGRRVHLLTEDRGTETIFISGAAQQRKLQGLLVLGNLLRCERKQTRGRWKLHPVGVDMMMEHATTDLDVFHHLSYVLELARSLSRDVPLESETFNLVVAYLEYLERVGADAFRLLTWQLALFDSIGMRLSPWPCRLTGERPNGVSLEQGGAVCVDRCHSAFEVSTQALWSLNQAWLSDYNEARGADADELHRLFAQIWQEFLGFGLKSAMFLESKIGSSEG
jgi:DNA repair protein RecO